MEWGMGKEVFTAKDAKSAKKIFFLRVLCGKFLSSVFPVYSLVNLFFLFPAPHSPLPLSLPRPYRKL